MQKSIEERLADIESGITGLTKMQACALKVLSTLHQKSLLTKRSEQALTLGKESIESVRQNADRYLILMFGGITVMGVAISMASLYLATSNFAAKVLAIVYPILALVFLFSSFFDARKTRSQLREAEKMVTQTVEDLESAKEEMAAVDNDLAQAFAEWKELAHDDLVSESSNGTPELKDSHDKS